MSAQRIFSALGSILRQTGQTIDAIGLRLQGRFGYREGGACLRSLSAPVYSDLQCYTSQTNLSRWTLDDIRGPAFR